MILEMPKVPTAREVMSMTDSEYSNVLESYFNFCKEAIGAIATLKCDLFDICYKNKEVKSKVNEVISYYDDSINTAHGVENWLLKVRHFGYKGEFQK